MGQKVNANGFRLGFTKGWNSLWYNPLYSQGYANMLLEDYKIQKYVKGSLKGSKKLINSINIYRNSDNTYIYFSYKGERIKPGRRYKKAKLLLRNRLLKIKALGLYSLLKNKKIKAPISIRSRKKYKIIKKLKNIKYRIKSKPYKLINKKYQFKKYNIINVYNPIKKNKLKIKKIYSKTNENKYIYNTKYLIEKKLIKGINNFISKKNYNNNNFNKLKKFNKKHYKTYFINPRKKYDKYRQITRFFPPLLNILKLKNKLKFITYSKIFLFLYKSKKFLGLPYNNVSLITKILATSFRIHTKLFTTVFKRYSEIFKILFPKVIKGMRIKYSGKVWGKGRSKTTSVQVGSIPLNSINDLVDYSFMKSQNKFGVIGIKVWLNHYHIGKNYKHYYLRTNEKKLLSRWRTVLVPLRFMKYRSEIKSYYNKFIEMYNNKKYYKKKIMTSNYHLLPVEKYIRFNLTYKARVKKYLKIYKLYNSYIKTKYKINKIKPYYKLKKFFNYIKNRQFLFIKNKKNIIIKNKKNNIMKIRYNPITILKPYINNNYNENYKKTLNKSSLNRFNNNINTFEKSNILNKSNNKNKLNIFNKPNIIQKRGYANLLLNPLTNKNISRKKIKFNNRKKQINDATAESYSNKIFKEIVDTRNKTKLFYFLSKFIQKLQNHYILKNRFYFRRDPLNKITEYILNRRYIHNPKKKHFKKAIKEMNIDRPLEMNPFLTKFNNYYKFFQSYNKLNFSMQNRSLYDFKRRLINRKDHRRIKRFITGKIYPNKFYFLKGSTDTNQLKIYRKKKYFFSFTNRRELPYKRYVSCIYEKRPLDYRADSLNFKKRIRGVLPYNYLYYVKLSKRHNLIENNNKEFYNLFNTLKLFKEIFAFKHEIQFIQLLKFHLYIKNFNFSFYEAKLNKKPEPRYQYIIPSHFSSSTDPLSEIDLLALETCGLQSISLEEDLIRLGQDVYLHNKLVRLEEPLLEKEIEHPSYPLIKYRLSKKYDYIESLKEIALDHRLAIRKKQYTIFPFSFPRLPQGFTLLLDNPVLLPNTLYFLLQTNEPSILQTPPLYNGPSLELLFLLIENPVLLPNTFSLFVQNRVKFKLRLPPKSPRKKKNVPEMVADLFKDKKNDTKKDKNNIEKENGPKETDGIPIYRFRQMSWQNEYNKNPAGYAFDNIKKYKTLSLKHDISSHYNNHTKYVKEYYKDTISYHRYKKRMNRRLIYQKKYRHNKQFNKYKNKFYIHNKNTK
jgi:ribosomal protein S3